MKVSRHLITGILIFPFNVMLVIPGAILWFSGEQGFPDFQLIFSHLSSTILSGLVIGSGLYLIFVTVSLFTDYGDGTPVPWHPPKKLVARGIYRHVRNPMISAVSCVLFGEAVLFRSLPIFVWFLIFVTLNLIYIPIIEERELERRFGDSYKDYKKNVPRWIPRLKPWKGPDG